MWLQSLLSGIEESSENRENAHKTFINWNPAITWNNVWHSESVQRAQRINEMACIWMAQPLQIKWNRVDSLQVMVCLDFDFNSTYSVVFFAF